MNPTPREQFAKIVVKHEVLRSEKKEKQAAKLQKQREGKKKVADVRAELDVTGEPTTEAIQKWRADEFLRAFVAEAGRASRQFRPGPFLRDLAHVKRFMELAESTLPEQSVAPRSILHLLRYAAKNLNRYRKESEAKKGIGTWMIASYANTILADAIHLLYGTRSVRYILEEHVDSRAIEIRKGAVPDVVYLDFDGLSYMHHVDELKKSVKNPDLRARLGFDNVTYHDPDGTMPNL